MKNFFWGALILGLLMAGCGRTSAPVFLVEQPEQINDGWTTATVEDVGLDGRRMAGLVDEVRLSGHGGLHSVLVVKDGKLVLEEYLGSFGADHLLSELTKPLGPRP